MVFQILKPKDKRIINGNVIIIKSKLNTKTSFN